MKTITLPKKALPYVLYQRTEYLKSNLLFAGLTYIGLVKPLYTWTVSMKSKLFAKQIAKSFEADMHSEYTRIAGDLPANARAILDIGCGVAGIDVLLSEHYRNQTDIYLLDKTAIDSRVYYGFEGRGSVYNSLALSQEILELNDVPKERIHTMEATDDNTLPAVSGGFDLVISLISWGFHYPVKTYIQQVYDALRPGGVLIFDIRSGTNGEDDVDFVFGSHSVVYESGKVLRIKAVKPVA
jgi:SAM-dependent methyltransferase